MTTAKIVFIADRRTNALQRRQKRMDQSCHCNVVSKLANQSKLHYLVHIVAELPLCDGPGLLMVALECSDL